ncbi:hypothetical protein C8R43DRAFT_1238500 [Mycena crocata]|nr:hypothetical protein C8R43DRAFT_1238500 [Mycena crocata]
MAPISLSLSLRRTLPASALPNSAPPPARLSPAPPITWPSQSLDLPAFDACTDDSALRTSNRAPLTPPPRRPRTPSTLSLPVSLPDLAMLSPTPTRCPRRSKLAYH